MIKNPQTLHLNQLNYRLLIAVVFTLLVPTLYNTFRIYLIGDIPSEWGFNIASQIAWLNIIYEVLQEAIILPLFFVLGPLVAHTRFFRQKITRGLITITALYTLIALLIWVSAGHLVHFLNQSPGLIAETIQYIRLETIAIPLRVITDIALIALITLSAKSRIYLFLLLQLVVRVVFDYTFINEAALGWGVIGIAYSTICINVVTALAGIFILFQTLRAPDQTQSAPSENISWRKWLQVSVLSGAESGVRNIAFVIMVLKMANEIGEQGTLWITNGFIWGWLLLPILALGTLIKQDVSTHGGVIGDRFKGYFSLSLVVCCAWILTIPMWGWFIQNIMGIDDYNAIVSLTLLFLPFYIIFAFNNILDSYFYGMGRTDLMLYQSLVVNCGYYVIAFILYVQGVFVPSLQAIALLFGFGIVLDMLTTMALFRFVRYPLKG